MPSSLTAPSTVTLLGLALLGGPVLAKSPSPASSSEAPSPEASIRVSDPRPALGRTFVLEAELRWSGGADALLPHPPAVPVPDGLEAGSVEASTRSHEGEHVTLYRLHLTAAAAGTYVLDPVELRWTPRGEPGPRSRSLAGPTVQVAAPMARGPMARGPMARGPMAGGMASPGRLPAAGTGAALVGLLSFATLLLSWLGRGRRRDAGRAAGPGHADARRERAALERLEELHRQACKLRQAGLPRPAVEVLVGIQRELDGGELLSAERLEEIRYGASPPPASELEGWERRVARQLEARRPESVRELEVPREVVRDPAPEQPAGTHTPRTRVWQLE